MKLNFNIKIKYALVLSVMLAFSSCEDMLKVEPQDAKIREEFWQIKADVEASMIGSYDALQNAIWEFFLWGELRGELIYTDINSVSINSGKTYRLRDIYNNDINFDMSVCQWGDIYSAINKINTVIKFAPIAEMNDNTFSKKELDEYIGECMTLRALCYFYLARTFHEFPYITSASESDQQEYIIPPVAGTIVMDSIVKNLKIAEQMVKTEYTDEDFERLEINNEGLEKAYRKGRVTTPVVWALLADVLLTQDNYAEALVYLNKIIDSGYGYELVSGSEWLKIFAEGNTNESIFELQFSNIYKDDGGGYQKDDNVSRWFGTSGSSGFQFFENKFNINTRTFSYWEGDDFSKVEEIQDYRAKGGTLNSNSKTLIWKWAGLSSRFDDYREQASYDANWIFYRYADILLMKAEALNRLNRTDEALTILIENVRERAIPADYDNVTANSVIEFETLLLDERARELAIEGKRWFDLMRIAKRQEDYTVIGLRLAEMRGRPQQQSFWLAKVFNPNSWYLPIHKRELELNPLLKQNSYYKQ